MSFEDLASAYMKSLTAAFALSMLERLEESRGRNVSNGSGIIITMIRIRLGGFGM